MSTAGFTRLSTLDELCEYADSSFKGYVWWDNDALPERVDSSFPLNEWHERERNGEFIVEGGMFQIGGPVRIMIHRHGDRYTITVVHLEQAEQAGHMRFVDQAFLAHRIRGIAKLVYRTAWLPCSDLLCNDMATLKPAWTVLTGWESDSPNHGG